MEAASPLMNCIHFIWMIEPIVILLFEVIQVGVVQHQHFFVPMRRITFLHMLVQDVELVLIFYLADHYFLIK